LLRGRSVATGRAANTLAAVTPLCSSWFPFFSYCIPVPPAYIFFLATMPFPYYVSALFTRTLASTLSYCIARKRTVAVDAACLSRETEPPSTQTRTQTRGFDYAFRASRTSFKQRNGGPLDKRQDEHTTKKVKAASEVAAQTKKEQHPVVPPHHHLHQPVVPPAGPEAGRLAQTCQLQKHRQ